MIVFPVSLKDFKHRNTFQTVLFLALVFIFSFVVTLDLLLLVEKTHLFNKNGEQDLSRKTDSIFVLFETYKKPDDKYIIYRVALDGNKEKEIWSASFKNTYQFSPLAYPNVSNDLNYLFYPASIELSSQEKFTIINSKTGKIRYIPNRLPNRYKNYAPLSCLWNNSDTKISCEMEGSKRSLLVSIEVKDGTSTILYDSTKNDLRFDIIYLLGWDKKDENIFVIGVKNSKDNIYKINVKSKKTTSQKGLNEKSRLSFFTYYSASLNKFIYLSPSSKNPDWKNLKIYDPKSQTVKLLYEKKDHYIGSSIFLTEDGKNLIFREDDFYINPGNKEIKPKDGVPTSKIIKLNIESGKKEVFNYPFDPKKCFLCLMEHYAGDNTVIVSKLEFTSPKNLDSYYKVLYSYNLSSKKLTKIFSRKNKDYPGKDIQFGVIPY